MTKKIIVVVFSLLITLLVTRSVFGVTVLPIPTGSSGGSNWSFFGGNFITPSTTVGLIVNSSSTFTGDFLVGGNSTTTGTQVANEYCINIGSPDCITSWPTGTGGGGGGSNWSFTGGDYLTPSTTVGIIVNASSTFAGALNLSNDLFFNHTSQDPYIKGSGSIGHLELSYDGGTNYLRISENDLRTSLPWATNVWPRTNNTYSLGTAGLQWSNVYATNLFGNISSTTVSVVSKTTDYTATVSDYIVQMDTTAGHATTTLPSAATVPGHTYTLKKISSDANIYGIEPAGAETIDGAIGKQIKFQWSAMKITSTGSNWIID